MLGAQIFGFLTFFCAIYVGREHELSEHYFISFLLIDARVELID
jgi:hypothetical protein